MSPNEQNHTTGLGHSKNIFANDWLRNYHSDTRWHLERFWEKVSELLRGHLRRGCLSSSSKYCNVGKQCLKLLQPSFYKWKAEAKVDEGIYGRFRNTNVQVVKKSAIIQAHIWTFTNVI